MVFRSLVATTAVLALVSSASLAGAEDNPEVPPRQIVAYAFGAEPGFAGSERDLIGASQSYTVAAGETFMDISRRFSLGYNELIAANPTLDPWVVDAGTRVVLPTEWILPGGTREGIVINVPEMRLYYYMPASKGAPATVLSYPVGLGRQEWRTPLAEFRVRGKTRNPTWVLPESVKIERIKEKGFAEDSIPGGHPDNPLGRHRIELTLGAYAIHGTNKNWGVGMQVSHGCVRMYPEDVAALFPLVQVGTKGRLDYQPVKVGVRGDRVFIEVHEDIYGMSAGMWQLAKDVVSESGLESRVDPAKLEAAVEASSGVPTDVGYASWPAPPLSAGADSGILSTAAEVGRAFE
jgi:L,D-transpeptidase ErfK/SrfK